MPSTRPTNRSTRSVVDSGTGSFGTLTGLVVILAFLLLATDVLLELQARSTVTAVAYEAAHRVAVSEDASRRDRADAEQHARRILGDVGATARFDWEADGDGVSLRIRASRPGALLTAVGLRSPDVDRTVSVRREVLR